MDSPSVAITGRVKHRIATMFARVSRIVPKSLRESVSPPLSKRLVRGKIDLEPSLSARMYSRSLWGRTAVRRGSFARSSSVYSLPLFLFAVADP
jgi:hypothetical protein